MAGHGFDLSGEVVLVTGSSRGIGAALAAGFAAAGARVVLHGSTAASVMGVQQELERSAPGRIAALAFDVRDGESVQRALAALPAAFSAISVLVNNAGVQYRAPLAELPQAEWDRVIGTNLTGAFVVSQAVLPGMQALGHGRIINICSLQSELARPSIGAYTAAKGGLKNLTRAMAAEWAAERINVNAIGPGYFATEMTRALVEDQEFSDWVVARTPARRWGQVEDLIGPALWLASDASRFVHGQLIMVDGGMSIVV